MNGGIAKYIEAFLGSEFLSSNPDQINNVTLLKNLIAHQIKIVENGLTLHGRLAPTPVRPLHTRLLERFATMRNTVNQANIETSQALLWTPQQQQQQQPKTVSISKSHSNLTSNRPSILSQPLPPIPNFPVRNDASSDPETSSLSSSSSISHNASSHDKGSHILISTSPLQLPTSLGYLVQSPNGKSLKNKPLPPLPSDENVFLPNFVPKPVLPPPFHPQRHNSTSFEHSNLIRSKSKQNLPLLDDSIYSVPQLPDIMMDCAEKGSSVDDDSLDYYDEFTTHGNNGHTGKHSKHMSTRIFRSRSIPRSSISHYNGINSHTESTPLLPPLQRGQSNQNLHELDQIDSAPPPPLPPRTVVNLDRSNSLNSSVRSSPLIPPLVPPALPQRPRVRKSSSTSNSSYTSNVPTVVSNNISTSISSSRESESYLANLDGIEFENLVISSPTPRSESTHQSNRPAPIIGIEIDDAVENDLFPATPMITDAMNTFVDAFGDNNNGGSDKLHQQTARSKSNSLPRMNSITNNIATNTGHYQASVTNGTNPQLLQTATTIINVSTPIDTTNSNTTICQFHETKSSLD